MTLDQITTALRGSGAIPKTALAQGVVHASNLAPLVFEIADKFCRGTYLLPGENNLLFYGLQILAAARQPSLCERVLAIARLPSQDIDRLFPDYITTGLSRLLLSSWDRDYDNLLGLIEHADMDAEVKWALFDVLARFTFDGRIPRERTVEFLARIERDGLIDDGNMTWWGWEQAVVKLGLAEFEPAMRRVWTKSIYKGHSDADHASTIDELKLNAQKACDPIIFDEVDVRAIDDPADAVSWIERRDEAMAEWAAERIAAGAAEVDDDPAKSLRLTDAEREWLAGFLVSRHVPEATMTFEMLDGFFTALVIGPAMVPPSQYLPVIWGTDGGIGPAWEDTEQAQYVLGLLMKHWNAIAARRSANALHAPHIEFFGESAPAAIWADGFASGINMRPDAWEPLFADRRADPIVLPILALIGDVPEEFYDRFTSERRGAVIKDLPVTLHMIDAYWRDPKQKLPLPMSGPSPPVRPAKIGRNEPCPCGSGKKFKKCCGGTSSSSLH